MNEQTCVMEYKCPCCTAGLRFGPDSQKLKCEYCENEFELDAVKAFNEEDASSVKEEYEVEAQPDDGWSEAEQENMHLFTCPSCGGEIITDITTAATFCPYCDNPTVLPGRLSGGLKPDAIIPFKTSKEDAKNAFLHLCKGKPLLPSIFLSSQQVEKITGVYVPFWLYDCGGSFAGSYKATRVHHWSDSHYNYTRTEHFLLRREAEAEFAGIPMDGSSKMEDTFMESIEPFDYSQLENFDTAYLTGYLADKYDVEVSAGHDRVRQRVNASMEGQIQSSILGYSTAIPTQRSVSIHRSKERYVLLPVWILNTRYQGKLYTFAMNGQTGKMTGKFPVCPKKSAAWFAGICAGVTAVSFLVQMMLR